MVTDGLAAALAPLETVAADPDGYVAAWKQRTGRAAIGAFGMNFPAEIAHAAGALPVLVQESREPDSYGRNLLAEFYCGYTRNIADQAARGRLGLYDGLFSADHCIQLLGALDVVRDEAPDLPMYFGQWPTSLGDGWTLDAARTTVGAFIEEIGAFTGTPVTAGRLAASIALFNENRRLLRGLYEARRQGSAVLRAADLQVLVKSSMVMDKAEHTAALRLVIAAAGAAPRDDRIRLHLSGHFCHAVKPELLAAIEDCGALVVDDDLFTGARYLSTDVREDLDPAEAIGDWYLRRDVNLPCPTRVKHGADWEDRLLAAVAASGAQGVIVLMAKFCEPHMLYYPQLRKRLTEQGVPHLLIETGHEGVPVETMRTRVEALLERIRRTRLAPQGVSG